MKIIWISCHFPKEVKTKHMYWKSVFLFKLFHEFFYFILMLAKNLLKEQGWILDKYCIIIKKKTTLYYSLWITSIFLSRATVSLCINQKITTLIYILQYWVSLCLHREMSCVWQDGVLFHSLEIMGGWEMRKIVLSIKAYDWFLFWHVENLPLCMTGT